MGYKAVKSSVYCIVFIFVCFIFCSISFCFCFRFVLFCFALYILRFRIFRYKTLSKSAGENYTHPVSKRSLLLN